ncbi:membrane protein [Pontibacillus halophilus JSM 076056 = DSM 19796]|uniref:Probable queuosine precursor transporter n=1 Tax=Pontibacillus halophilus JSM 076056 = DSM 19796 TaxID=1385510 RepID=A0A0A5GL49_9BACI|nr:queuosine precursor transporter [Pontibacillus halophilus]KGX91938.1 membrane protein [Pontibacillus halophilus JSM 076056 = DSM 19796]
MFNELYWLLFAIINFSLILVMYRIFGRTGLFVWIGMSTVVANIQVTKMVELFGMTATLGNIIYGTAFLATDILNEKYGKNDAKRAVWMGFFTLISMTIMMQLALQFIPAESDVVQDALNTIFSQIPKVAIGSLLAYLVSQYVDVLIYSAIKARLPQDKFLWVRNNGSTMVSQLLDTLVFTAIAFYGTPWDIWFEIFLTTYVIKFIVAAADTPFLYVAKRFKHGK